jgi:pimeloyl-ACP methyl ester carboxylesterase
MVGAIIRGGLMPTLRSIRQRRRFRPNLLTAIVAGVLSSLLAMPTATAGATLVSSAADGPPIPRLVWRHCGEGLECTTAKVPLDYDRPHGATISLSLIRLPAGDAVRRIGSIFLNPGGPGLSGVDSIRQAGRSLFSAEVRARFDLVGFDPRGIIGSTPLRCFDTLEQAQAVLPPFRFPVTAGEERSWIQADRTFAGACARRGGPIIDHMATGDAARDLDLLRQAVGDRRLTYVALSYGAYLGATYANLFPGKVRALELDAAPDPVAWSTGRGNQARTQPLFNRLGSAQGAYATLLEFFRLCDRGGSTCAFSQGEPRRRYAALAKRLLANPAQTPDGPVTYADLVGGTLDAMKDPAEWPDLADTLQQLDSLTARQVRGRATAPQARPIRSAVPQQRYPNILEGLPGVACSDSDNPAHVEAWKLAADASEHTAPYFGRYWTWLSSICQPWPGRDTDRYTGRWTKPTVNPVLIVGNRFDPASPYQGAVTLARLLPRSRLLTLDGWGHTSEGKSSCIDAHTNRYLLTTRVPPRDTVCQPDVVPFATPAPAQRPNGIRTPDLPVTRTRQDGKRWQGGQAVAGQEG